ncbi:MAG: GntR family transcriptional regulator [Actinobacteria bacterium]|nr:GntR family transcriptional regulator [Actinomycetota bacterium]
MATFRALQAASLVEQAYEEIRSAILGGILKPGSAVSEAAIAREMGISRGPLREALRLLEQAGLVVSEPNRGHRVPVFTEEDLEEFASIRLALEGLAIRGALEAADGPERLREIVERMRRASRRGDRAAAVTLDREFHETIVELSGHRRLLTVWNLLRDQIELAVAEISLTYPTLAGRADAHVPLLESMERRDLAGALAALESHIYDSELLQEARRRTGRRDPEPSGGEAEGAGGGAGP